MTKQELINEAKRRFDEESKRNFLLTTGRAVVPSLPQNHYAIFYNGRFQSLETGSGDYYEGY